MKRGPGQCFICGDVTDDAYYGRFWSPDDGWKIGALCSGDYKQFGDAKPQPDDFAYDRRGTIDDDCIETDLDILEML